MMNQGHLDPESEHIREVYAHFGLAMYMAQCLERGLAVTLATRYGPGPTKISRTQYDELLEKLFSRTLGQLVKEIGRLAELNANERDQLQEALSKRNWLAHRYFWERTIDLVSESGRASMIKELQEATDSFQALDDLFTKKTWPFANSWDCGLAGWWWGSC